MFAFNKQHTHTTHAHAFDSYTKPKSIMKKIFLFAAAVSMLSLMSCAQNNVKGDGNYKTETRNHSGFKGVGAGGDFDVEIKTGSGYSVEIMADGNLMQYIETDVNNGVLRINTRDNHNLRASKPIKVNVVMPVLESASVAGSGDMFSSGVLTVGNQLKVSLAGSGTCKLHVAPNANIKASIAGSGDIRMRGATDNLSVSIAGSGNFEGFELSANKADVRISGSGDVQTNVSNELSASIAGSGDVQYKGNATTSLKAAGSGSITKVN